MIPRHVQRPWLPHARRRACNTTQQVAIRRKHDLIYNQSAEIFPEAAFDAFNRGAVERFTEGDQTGVM